MTICHLCGYEANSIGYHNRTAHGVQGIPSGQRSTLSIERHLAFGDEVVAREAMWASINREPLPAMTASDRVLAAVMCIEAGHRSRAPMGLGVSGQTLRVLQRLIDSGEIDDLRRSAMAALVAS